MLGIGPPAFTAAEAPSRHSAFELSPRQWLRVPSLIVENSSLSKFRSIRSSPIAAAMFALAATLSSPLMKVLAPGPRTVRSPRVRRAQSATSSPAAASFAWCSNSLAHSAVGAP